MDIESRYLTIRQAATYADLAPISMCRAIKAGRLPAFNVLGSRERPTYG
jgi:hypothetical protein